MGRPKRPIESLMVDVPLKVLPETAKEIEALAIRLERSKSFISRKLVLRGLAAYLRDGSLDDPLEPIIDDQPTPIPASEVLKAIANGAPVKASRIGRPSRKGGRK